MPGGTYYFGTAANEYDWTSPRNNNLWLDGVKTLFDPCPAGWRIGPNGTWSDFGADPYAAPFYYYIDGVRQTAPGVPAFALSPNNGRRYDRGGSSLTAWYPGTGYRDAGRENFEGVIRGFSGEGSVWSSTVSGPNATYLYFYSLWLNPIGAAGRGFGFSVRCLRE